MTTIYKNQRYISIGVYLIVLLTWVAVIHHVFFETEPNEINVAASVHKDAKRIRNNTASSVFPLMHSFVNGELTKEEFIATGFELEDKFNEYTDKSSSLYKEVGRLKAKHRTFGFSSYNIFSFQLSMRIVLFSCIALLMIAIRIREKTRLLLRVLNIATCNFLIICAFYTTWVFYGGNDLNYLAYLGLTILISITMGIIFYLGMGWFYKIIENRTNDKEFIEEAKLTLQVLKEIVTEGNELKKYQENP